jgi:hypothetical protein
MTRRPLIPLSAAASVLVALLLPAAPAQAAPTAASCDPVQTAPVLRPDVPTATEVLGFPLGERDVTTAESDSYLQAVDAASARVSGGTLGTSVQGRPLRYAVVGKPAHVTPAGLARIAAAAAALRNPRTPPALARFLAARTPAILWVAGNVHGNEESGTDATLRVLYELAAREDCAADRILDNAVVVLLPTQNPDGREADARRNVYGFDLNRDWFARTQPETDHKLQLLRRLPPVLFIDAHEMGRQTYFFPPNADPIYHEITDESVSWINDLYGASLIAEFTRQGIPFFNRDVYDLFYMGYGDTVPSTGFIAAGMTFEKANGDPAPRRVYEQYLTQWVSLSAAAARKRDLLTAWHGAYVEAYAQGRAGHLEPNQIVNPGNELVTQVPDRPVRHYFLRADDPDKAAEVRALVRRLQRMDVRVNRLVRPLRVPDYTPYHRSPRSTVLPVGTYWIPMAQAQKHWVQAMLNEDTYTPFPYFYDVTGWSNPLLFNVAGGYSGAALRPLAVRTLPVAAPATPRPPAGAPTIGLFQLGEGTSAIESSGWLRWLLEQKWKLPYRELTAESIAAGELSDVDVLLVPNGSAADGAEALGPAGSAALAAWVRAGGRYVGWRAGAELAALLGISSAVLAEPTSDVPGSLFRVSVAPGPLARGVGREAWVFYEYDRVMRSADPAAVAVAFPPAGSEDFAVSGFERGAEAELGGTAAVLDERVGSGRSVVLSIEPNFRGFTDGTQEILRNAILGPGEGAAVAVSSRAAAAARGLSELQRPVRLSVAPADAAAAAAVLDRAGLAYERRTAAGSVRFAVVNRGQLDADQLPWLDSVLRGLRAAGVTPLAFTAP